MLQVKDRRLLRFVSDYKLNLIVPEEIKSFEKFHSELGPLFEFISCADDGDELEVALMEHGTRWENMSFEAIQLLNECFDAKIEIDNEKGAGNVCKGIDELVARGEARGKAEGEARLSKLVNILCSQKSRKQRKGMVNDGFCENAACTGSCRNGEFLPCGREMLYLTARIDTQHQ